MNADEGLTEQVEEADVRMVAALVLGLPEESQQQRQQDDGRQQREPQRRVERQQKIGPPDASARRRPHQHRKTILRIFLKKIIWLCNMGLKT